MAEAEYRVSGRVQGVGFRWWTRSLATRLGLSGSVCNLADGAVAVYARGPDDQLAVLRAQLAQGPAGARVDRVESLPFSPDKAGGDGFHILR